MKPISAYLHWSVVFYSEMYSHSLCIFSRWSVVVSVRCHWSIYSKTCLIVFILSKSYFYKIHLINKQYNSHIFWIKDFILTIFFSSVEIHKRLNTRAYDELDFFNFSFGSISCHRRYILTKQSKCIRISQMIHYMRVYLIFVRFSCILVHTKLL